MPLAVLPNAELPAPSSKVTPAPGPFNGTARLVFESARAGATIYLSVDGADPRITSKGRIEGPSGLTVPISATTTVRWFASEGGKDEELHEGTWVRAGGPVGSITGVVVVGSSLAGKAIGIARNFQTKQLGLAQGPYPQQIPFAFEGLQAGIHQLTAAADSNGDGQAVPLIDTSSAGVTVTLDFTDPFKASAESVTLYLAASPPTLGTLSGTVEFANAPGSQALRLSALSASALSVGFDAQALLSQLQNGAQLFTNATDRRYPYVLTDLKPGSYLPAPALVGVGAGGAAVNFIANPLRPVQVSAGAVSTANFFFGPASLTGEVTVTPGTPVAGLVYGVVAARSTSLAEGLQVVLMPVIFGPGANGTLVGSYAGASLRANSSFALRGFTSLSSANVLTDALTWAVNPLAAQPAHATVTTGAGSTVADFVVP